MRQLLGSFTGNMDQRTSTLVLFTLGNPLKEVGQWQWLLALESKVTFGFRTEKIGRLHDPGPDILQPLSNVLTAVGVSRAPTMSNVPGRGTGLWPRYAEAG